MIEMKREKPSEVEGFSLKRLKLVMNALLSIYSFIGLCFDTIMRLIDSESDYPFGNCLFL